MKRILLVVIALASAFYALEYSSSTGQRFPGHGNSEAALDEAIRARRAGYQVQGSGKVVRILSDDRDGSRHQRFIVQLASGQTLLIAHNIDLAPRVADLKPGHIVAFYGEYEWNERGGVIHWTHHDPRGQHAAGWVEHNGVRYQ
ncbi:MAG: DUF3465 domain-containing protein [Woeseiaceae bacterium]|jgi:hypothetical protein